MTNQYDVVIIGAGPVGLLLACELALGKTSVIVLEREASPVSPWKEEPTGMRGLHLPSSEILWRRGLLEKIWTLEGRPHGPTKTPGFQFAGHFAGIPLNLSQLDLDRWKYRLRGPSLMGGPITIALIERVLAERAESLGVEIHRGCGFERIVQQSADGVTIEAGEETQTFHAKWLIGCDGGRSQVRKAAEIDFPGTDATLTGYVIHCDLDHPERLSPGFQPTKQGMYIFRKPGALYLMDFDGGAGQTREPSQQRLQEVMERVVGRTDIKLEKVHLASAFTDRGKQATTYRKGRVLLAGDAAHIHPPLGAQGMNAGLGDAMNLGWKLAATVRGEEKGVRAFTVLDTYTSERHPVGQWVLEWNYAQVAALKPDVTGYAVQKLMRDLIATDDGTNYFIDNVWGLSQRYGDGEGVHPVVGRSAPDFTFKDGSRLGPKLEGGRGLFIDFEDVDLEKAVKRFERVDYLGQNVEDRRGIRALLIRPDGFVAWAVEEGDEPDAEGLETELKKWFSY
ncbi:Monoogygenase [Colletotrichum sidae]|uniref:Monoogygenase n=2 Tax=Colletotrichum orbiculare species complex TaxID=2707354 RepID=N4UZW5_COLOR|nr:Monoogygenase [Colletotrichum orbiculare MAFF 240422]TEA14225.1 Monoogygenase [Colletotrichum sidae]